LSVRPEGAAEPLDRPATTRVFFALWPPPVLAGKLADIAVTAAGQFGGRPTRRDTIHMTLAFLGDVAEARLPLLCASASRVVARSFDLTVDRLGFWRHNHLLWAGCRAVPPALPTLAGELSAVLDQAGFAIADRERRFAPHVTLLRRVPADDCQPLPAIDPLRWSCAHFVLVRSRLSAAGSSYQTLAEFPLLS